METTSEKILHSMHTMLTQAEIDFDMWTAMRKARADREFIIMLNRRYGRFYAAAENAFFNSIITILYSALEKRYDTVNLWQLRRNLPADSDPNALLEVDKMLSELKEIWIRVGIIRNEVVGHQSLKRSSIESHKLANIRSDEIKKMVLSCQELLAFISIKFHDTQMIFNLKGAESFERLVADLRTNNSLKPIHQRSVDHAPTPR